MSIVEELSSYELDLCVESIKEEVMDEKCKASVLDYGAYSPRRCIRRATKDGWCGLHHPDVVSKRREMKLKKYQEKMERSPHRRLEKALKEIEALKARLTQNPEDARCQLYKLIHKYQEYQDEAARLNTENDWLRKQLKVIK